MREIDPIRNPSEALLSSALNRLASGSPKSAPDEVGGHLLREYRQHHRRRRQKRMAIIGSIAACILAVALLLGQRGAWSHGSQSPIAHAQNGQQAGTSAQSEKPSDLPSSPTVASAEPASAATSPNSGAAAFVTLSPYDSTVSAADLTIVRVELTGSDLRLLGAPVTEDLSDQRLLADVVVSGDGTPYALRIVR